MNTGRILNVTLYSFGCGLDIFESDTHLFVWMLFHFFAHLELLHLSCYGHGKSFDKTDVLGYLKAGHVVFAEIDDFSGGCGLAPMQLNPAGHLFTVKLVGNTKHCQRGNFWVGKEAILDLSRIDILAATDNHLFQAPSDLDIPIGIHGAQISGMQPAGFIDGLSRIFRLAVITTHDVITSKTDLAHFAKR